MCDIGPAADTAALVDNTPARYGRLDGAFNNAGISGGGGGRLADLSEERFDELSRVNFKGIWLAMRAEIPAPLRDPHAGAIVNTSSVGGLRGAPNLSAYPATKRAVIDLTTTAAHDYGRDGLRVNAIASGTTDIDMIAAWKRHDPGIAERLNAITPLGRDAFPADGLLEPNGLSRRCHRESGRAELAVIAHRGSTCLSFDELTNHLDIESVAVLEAALEDGPGADRRDA